MEFFKPNVSEELAKDLVLKLYGLNVIAIKSMISYDDQNFYVKVSEMHSNKYLDSVAETGYTLKITNTARSSMKGHFDIIHATMIHLHQKGLQAPVPVKNLKGTTWSLEKVPLRNEDEKGDDTKRCGVHLLTYLPGIPISSTECSKDILYQWGKLLAQYHNATEDLICPGLKDKYVLWNLENTPKIKECLSAVSDIHKKELVDSVLERYLAEIALNDLNLPRGNIHGDFNENNILAQVQTSGCITVEGILDFEDAHEGTYTWDVAVMMMYAMLVYKEPDDLDATGHTLAGYLSARPLNDLELNSLKTCIECRFCQSLVYGAYSFSRDPNNHYILESSKTGWDKLKKIAAEDNEELLRRWKNIASTRH